ncbi:DUF1329 domain-containing protein [Paracraurococcus lichenis]|uniref:DUF1329 domain-containing protein n=1 Tax=Paracraurococcus lichenis TaxID=3064888 RepID=A0ABT9E784_9PROT|nr:DUF1329 domain-containing protein [Paracraurococcus sp. LOR1-02]MDO9711920.1 DUF1329 domain-containing protein [Paracraurococcus sp. LOR1-02]
MPIAGRSRRTALAGLGAAMAAPLALPALAQRAGLTPLGADLAGNAAGTIPRWAGGLTALPPDGEDPYATDPVVQVLGAAEADDPRLAPGHAALLRARPGFRIRLLPSRRSAAVPGFVLRATEANPGRARLVSGGNGVAGAAIGIPFPRPANGLEAIWNHMLRWRFQALQRTVAFAAPLANGSYTLGRTLDRTLYPYNAPDAAPETVGPASQLLVYVTLAPAEYGRLALLSHQPLDFGQEGTRYWFYVPGDRRVAFSADTAFDVPNRLFDGLRTVDNADIFAGSPERYAWTLLGKRETIVPYNSFALTSPRRRYAEVLQPGALNPALARYELHRVWVVEARLRPGQRHRFPRRVFYLDEDSWQALLIEHYDARGALQRVSEAHPVQYDRPLSFYASVDVVHDLPTGRYGVFGMPNEEPPIDTGPALTPADFTPPAFRSLVTR